MLYVSFPQPMRGNCHAGSPISCAAKAAPKLRTNGVSKITSGLVRASASLAPRMRSSPTFANQSSGAVFLDGGYAAAKEVVAHVFAPRMRAPRRPLRDPKTALQEWAQARGLETPLYRETGRTGPPSCAGIYRGSRRDGLCGGGRQRRLQTQCRAGRGVGLPHTRRD